jgi:hypothetical protein
MRYFEILFNSSLILIYWVHRTYSILVLSFISCIILINFWSQATFSTIFTSKEQALRHIYLLIYKFINALNLFLALLNILLFCENRFFICWIIVQYIIIWLIKFSFSKFITFSKLFCYYGTFGSLIRLICNVSERLRCLHYFQRWHSSKWIIA